MQTEAAEKIDELVTPVAVAFEKTKVQSEKWLHLGAHGCTRNDSWNYLSMI